MRHAGMSDTSASASITVTKPWRANGREGPLPDLGGDYSLTASARGASGGATSFAVLALYRAAFDWHIVRYGANFLRYLQACEQFDVTRRPTKRRQLDALRALDATVSRPYFRETRARRFFVVITGSEVSTDNFNRGAAAGLIIQHRYGVDSQCDVRSGEKNR
jgi:hypothetical protein